MHKIKKHRDSVFLFYFEIIYIFFYIVRVKPFLPVWTIYIYFSCYCFSSSYFYSFFTDFIGRRKRFKMLVRIRECFFTVSLYPSSPTYLFFTYWWLVFIQFSTTFSNFIDVYFCANLNNLFHAYCISMAKFDLTDLNDLYRWSLKSIFKHADYILLLIIIYLCGFFYNLIL